MAKNILTLGNGGIAPRRPIEQRFEDLKHLTLASLTVLMNEVYAIDDKDQIDTYRLAIEEINKGFKAKEAAKTPAEIEAAQKQLDEIPINLKRFNDVNNYLALIQKI